MKTLNYNGSGNYHEAGVTGRMVLWQPGERQSVPDAVATTLIATGNFVDVTGLINTAGVDELIISASAPSNSDGRADGTIWIQTA